MKKPLMRMFALCFAVLLLLGIFPFAFAAEHSTEEASATENTSATLDPPKTDTKNNNPEGYVYKSGIIWGADSSKEFDAVYNGKKNHVYCVSTHNVKHNGSYVPCYCIDPGIEIGTGTPYDDYLLTTKDAWNSMSRQQRDAIGLALIYGYPNGINPSSFLDKKGAQAATQMIIWEICYGMRNPYHPFTCTDNRYYNLFESDSVGHEFTDGGTGANNGWIHNMKAVYQQISDKMAQHFTRPSFLSTDTDTAQIYDLTPNGNGTYSVTLTDSNNMLSAINFTNTDNLTFMKNGNTLTITANKPVTEVTVKATKNVPNLEVQTFIVWKHTDKQMIVEPVSPTSDPTSLYLKLRVRTGNLSIKKTTSDGKMLEGWQFILYSDQACTNKVYGPYTTASDSTITANNLTAGTYWIKEVGNTDPDVQARYKCEGENPRKITVTAGQTTSVAFNNVLQTGNLSIKKTTSDGEMLGGWKFTIYSDQACTKKVYGPYTTASDGTITAKDLLVGTYWIREEGNVDPEVDKLYKCQGENPRKITLTTGQTVSIAFNNVKQIGAVKIVKKTNTGGTLANWKIGIYTDEACTTQRNYVRRIYANGTPDKSSTLRSLRNYTNLKECYVVRYADDFKIFCKKRSDADKLFEATKQWLLERLGLEISPEKSKVVNLKRHYSEFLGFKLKVRTKGKTPNGQPRYVIEAHMKEKALLKIREKSKEIIGQIRKTYDPGMEYRLIQKYNSYVIGVHNYYCIATHVNRDFHKIAYDVKKSLYNRLKHRLQKKGQITNRYIKGKYGTSREVRYLNGHAIVPIAYVQHRAPMDKKLKINKYTPEGRAEIHRNLVDINLGVLYYLMNTPCGKQSVEYNDNRIALYVAQKGKCAVSGIELESNQVDCHHKKPISLGGDDSYQNLIIVSDVIHILIHSSNERTVRKYLKVLNLDQKQFAKLNKLRVMAEMPELVL